jgi:hypothetical protein
MGDGFVIEVFVVVGAQTHHRLKSVYMDYLVDVSPAGPPFPRLVARGVGTSPARPGMFRKTLFYPRRLRTGRVSKPAKRFFFLLITTPWMSGHGLGGLAGRSAKKNGVFRKNGPQKRRNPGYLPVGVVRGDGSKQLRQLVPGTAHFLLSRAFHRLYAAVAGKTKKGA